MAINSLSASSNGLSGLVSGMDTQQMVEKMLSGTQSKINKATQKKTTLQNKQQMYREVAAKLTALQSSYLSFTSKTNLLSNSFYSTMKTTLSPPTGRSAAFSVSGSSNAKAGTVTMNSITQLATARTSKTQAAATGDVAGILSQPAAKEMLKSYTGANATMTIKIGDTEVAFNEVATQFGGKTQSEVADIINTALGALGEARFVNNKLQIKATDPEAVISIYGNKGAGSSTEKAFATKMFGMAEISGSDKGIFNATIDTNAYLPSFDVDLDGRKQTVYLDVNILKEYAAAATTGDIATAQGEIKANIEEQVKRFFGTGVKVSMTGGVLKFETGVISQRVTITGGADVMGTLGLKTGISSKLTTGMLLKDLNFATALSGDQHTFTINGMQFSYSSNTSLDTVINDINGSRAGVKVSYLAGEDRFVMRSSETGAGTEDFSISQSEGNLMSVLFGLKGSGMAQGCGVTVEMRGTTVSQSDIKDGGTFTFNINGSNVQFTVSRKKDDEPFTLDTFAEEMNKQFKTRCGTMPDGTQKVEFVNDGGQFVIKVNDNTAVIKAVDYDKNTNQKSLGFDVGQSTVAADGSVTLAQAGLHFGDQSQIRLTIGGTDHFIDSATLNAATSLSDLARIINDEMRLADPSLPAGADKPLSFDSNTGAFRLMGVTIPMEIAVVKGNDSASDMSTGLENLFGQSAISVNLPATAAALQNTDAGQNAKFQLDGVDMERANNTFTIEGLTYTLHDVEAEASRIAVTRDTEQIVEGIQEFLKMYNETIDYITGLFKADATYKDYLPLAAEQKANMSDKEIEAWEEKSKEGLLRNDQYLERILSSLRTAMYTKPEGSGIAIYDLGITTSFYKNEGNFNAENIDDLRSAIEADPEAVRRLFAGAGGIMELVNTAINEAAKGSYASPGYLTAVAGSNLLDTTSSIYKQIKEIDTQLTTLEDRYWSEYNRYWKQFNAMEQMISQMNSQSSWLSQQFSS